MRPGPTTLDLAPAPAYLASGDLKYLNSHTYVCDEEGRFVPGRGRGNWGDATQRSGSRRACRCVSVTHVLPGRALHTRNLMAGWSPIPATGTPCRIGGGTRGHQHSTYRLAKTTKARTANHAGDRAAESQRVGNRGDGVGDGPDERQRHLPRLPRHLDGSDPERRRDADHRQWPSPSGSTAPRARSAFRPRTTRWCAAPEPSFVTGRLVFPDLTTVFLTRQATSSRVTRRPPPRRAGNCPASRVVHHGQDRGGRHRPALHHRAGGGCRGRHGRLHSDPLPPGGRGRPGVLVGYRGPCHGPHTPQRFRVLPPEPAGRDHPDLPDHHHRRHPGRAGRAVHRETVPHRLDTERLPQNGPGRVHGHGDHQRQRPRADRPHRPGGGRRGIHRRLLRNPAPQPRHGADPELRGLSQRTAPPPPTTPPRRLGP